MIHYPGRTENPRFDTIIKILQSALGVGPRADTIILSETDVQDLTNHVNLLQSVTNSEPEQEESDYYLHLKFGQGGLVVAWGVDKERPFVSIRRAVEQAEIGTPVDSLNKGPLLAILQFPTETQAKAVYMALLPLSTSTVSVNDEAATVGDV